MRLDDLSYLCGILLPSSTRIYHKGRASSSLTGQLTLKDRRVLPRMVLLQIRLATNRNATNNVICQSQPSLAWRTSRAVIQFLGSLLQLPIPCLKPQCFLGANLYRMIHPTSCKREVFKKAQCQLK